MEKQREEWGGEWTVRSQTSFSVDKKKKNRRKFKGSQTASVTWETGQQQEETQIHKKLDINKDL